MGHSHIQQKNGQLTTEIAILNLEGMTHWYFNFIGKHGKHTPMAWEICCLLFWQYWWTTFMGLMWILTKKLKKVAWLFPLPEQKNSRTIWDSMQDVLPGAWIDNCNSLKMQMTTLSKFIKCSIKKKKIWPFWRNKTSSQTFHDHFLVTVFPDFPCWWEPGIRNIQLNMLKAYKLLISVVWDLTCLDLSCGGRGVQMYMLLPTKN